MIQKLRIIYEKGSVKERLKEFENLMQNDDYGHFDYVSFSFNLNQEIHCFLRSMIARYLKENNDPIFDGLPLSKAIECATVEEYIQCVVTNPGEDAKSMILSLAPIVLRINIATVFLDKNNAGDPDPNKRVQYFPYSSSGSQLKITRNDDLDLHDKEIAVMLKPGHYDALYKDQDIIYFLDPIPGQVPNPVQDDKKKKEIEEILKKINDKIGNDKIIDRTHLERMLNGFLTSEEMSELKITPHEFIEIFAFGDSFAKEHDSSNKLLEDNHCLQTSVSMEMKRKVDKLASFKTKGFYYLLCCHKIIMYNEREDFLKNSPGYLCPSCKKDLNLFSIKILSGSDIKGICMEKKYCGSCGKVHNNGNLMKYMNCDHYNCRDCHKKFIPCNICNN